MINGFFNPPFPALKAEYPVIRLGLLASSCGPTRITHQMTVPITNLYIDICTCIFSVTCFASMRFCHFDIGTLYMAKLLVFYIFLEDGLVMFPLIPYYYMYDCIVGIFHGGNAVFADLAQTVKMYSLSYVVKRRRCVHV